MEWKGIFPALTTPFTANDELDLPMFEKNLNAQVTAGVHGVIIGGSLGESSTLSPSEQEELIKFALKRVGTKYL
jgi:4-hydroxy-tetrahydrodipicolinate synthase